MSRTGSLTVSLPSATLSPSTLPPTPSTVSCGRCGSEIETPDLVSISDANARIAELEAQIKILTLRATSAVEQATEYESELRRVASARTPPPSAWSTRRPPTPVRTISAGHEPVPPPSHTGLSTPHVVPATRTPTPTSSGLVAAPEPVPAPAHSRLARLLTRSASAAGALPSSAPLRPAFLSLARGSDSNITRGPSYPATAGLPPTEAKLLDALSQEQARREAAEHAAAQTNSELEELTGQLFQQANEMVATERKARAKLEERIEMLERRDGEKAQRLGVLERRVLRVERVRGLLEREKALSQPETNLPNQSSDVPSASAGV